MEAAEEPVQSTPPSATPAGESQHSMPAPSVTRTLDDALQPGNEVQTPAPSVTRALPETLPAENGTLLTPPISPYSPPVSMAPAAQQVAPGYAYEHFGMPEATFQPGRVTPLGPQPEARHSAFSYPQAAYYNTFPGQLYTVPPPVPKKRRYGLWIALIVVLVLLLAGGSTLTFALTQSHPTPDSTIQTYCHGVKTSNAQEVYNTLSQQARAKTSLADIQRMFQSLGELSSLGISYSDCTFSDVHVSGSLAIATVTLTLTMNSEGTSLSVPSASLVSLVLEDNQWKIDFSNLTQPVPDLFPSTV